MSHVGRLFREGVCWGAAIVFVIVALPLVALAAFVLRPVLLLAVMTAGVSLAALCCGSARFRCWLGRHLAGAGEEVRVPVPGRR